MPDQDKPSSNLALNTSLQTWVYLADAGEKIQEGFAEIPVDFYPDNPAKEGIFPMNIESFSKLFTKYILPFIPVVSLISSWLTTWNTFKLYYMARNKNYDNTLDLTLNVLTTTATTLFWGLIIFGSAITVVNIAPYVLITALGGSMVYGLYNLAKSIYDTARSKTSNERAKHGWDIWKHLLNFVTNILGFAATVAFGVQIGPKLIDASSLFQDALKNWDFRKLAQAIVLTEAAGNLFRAVKSLFYAFTGLITLGLATSAWETNIETWQLLARPELRFKHFLSQYDYMVDSVNNLPNYAKPIGVIIAAPIILIFAVLEAVDIGARAVSLIVWPLQKFFYKHELPENQARMDKAEVQANAIEEVKDDGAKNDRQIVDKLEAARLLEHQQLAELLDFRLKKVERDIAINPTSKRIQKRDFLIELRDNKLKTPANYDFGVKADAYKAHRPRVDQSFWRRVAGTTKVANAFDNFDQKFGRI